MGRILTSYSLIKRFNVIKEFGEPQAVVLLIGEIVHPRNGLALCRFRGAGFGTHRRHSLRGRDSLRFARGLDFYDPSPRTCGRGWFRVFLQFANVFLFTPLARNCRFFRRGVLAGVGVLRDSNSNR